MAENLKLMLTPEFMAAILLPAIIGGIAVTLCSSLLGVTLVLKKYSMIGDGLSHIGYGALSVAAVMNLAPLKVALPVVIAAAFVLLRLSESGKLAGDSAIALFSTTALAIGILVSSKAGLTNDVSHYMFGSILAMNKSEQSDAIYNSACMSVKSVDSILNENLSKSSPETITMPPILI